MPTRVATAWRDSPHDLDNDAPADVWEQIDRMKLSEAAKDILEEKIVDKSTCHSLWIIAGSGGSRSTRLAVLDDDAPSESALAQFEW